MSKITLGAYRHYKGDEYHVFAVGTHTETKEIFVLYQSLTKKESIWCCPLSLFLEPVLIDGVSVPRFTLIPDE